MDILCWWACRVIYKMYIYGCLSKINFTYECYGNGPKKHSKIRQQQNGGKEQFYIHKRVIRHWTTERKIQLCKVNLSGVSYGYKEVVELEVGSKSMRLWYCGSP